MESSSFLEKCEVFSVNNNLMFLGPYSHGYLGIEVVEAKGILNQIDFSVDGNSGASIGFTRKFNHRAVPHELMEVHQLSVEVGV
jgi:hypothetical protein